MLATWGTSTGIGALFASSSLSLDFSNSSYTLGGVPYAVASVPGYTFTRASGGYAETTAGDLTWFTGTRTNLNLQSQTLENASWTKSGTSVSANITLAPDGTLTADKLIEDTANSGHSIAAFTPVSGTAYSFSIYAKAAEKTKLTFFGGGFGAQGFTATFDLTNGTMFNNAGGKASISSSENGWYRCVVTFTPSATGIINYNLISATNTTPYTGDGVSGLYLWGAQVETATDTRITYPTAYIPTTTAAVSVDTPRITNKGYLSEEARTNLVTYSQSFSNWNLSDVVVTSSNNLAPDGTSTASLLTEGSGGSATNQSQTATVTASSTEATSLYLKRGNTDWVRVFYATASTFTNGAQVWVNLATGALGTFSARGAGTATAATITPAANGFYRVGFTAVASTDTAVTITIVSASANGSSTRVAGATYYAWGAQLEAGAFATSYIPTTTAAATRAADIMNYSGITPNASLTMATKWIPNVITNNTERRILFWQNSTTGIWNDFIGFFQGNTLTQTESASGGVFVFGLSGANVTVNTLQNAAISVRVGKAAMAVGGAITQTTTSVSTIPSLNNLEIGNHRGSGGGILNGYIQSATIYPTALTDAQLQAITT